MMKALVLVAGLFFSFNTYADYVKGGVGYSLGGEIKGSNGVLSTTEDLESSFLFPIVAAYGFEVYDQFNLELEFAYRNNEYEDANSLDVSATTLGVNLAGSFPLSSAAALTGGIGLTFGSYDPGTQLDEDGTAFGIQVFGGADFKVQDNLTLGGELRYMTTITDIDLGRGNDGDYNNTAVLFVAKFAL